MEKYNRTKLFTYSSILDTLIKLGSPIPLDIYTYMSPLSRSDVIGRVLLLILLVSRCSDATAADTFLYAGCSPNKCTPGSQYESNLNSLLTSLVSSSSFSSSSNLTVGAAHGLYQCRPDNPDCSACVSSCVSQLDAACPYSFSAALRLEGCYVRYDNASFFGVEDKTLVLKKCGPGQLDSFSGQTASRDSVLGYLLASEGQLFRASGDGDVKGVAECVVGLSPAQCQDCLEEAIGLLKTECWYASSGDIFLATCYARYTATVSHAASIPKPAESSTNNIGTEKRLAIIIGVIAIVGLIVIIAVFLKKHSKDSDSCHHDHK